MIPKAELGLSSETISDLCGGMTLISWTCSWPREVLQFTQSTTWEQFEQDEVLQHAAMRLIQIIGEAARHVSPESTEQHPEIPWRTLSESGRWCKRTSRN